MRREESDSTFSSSNPLRSESCRTSPQPGRAPLGVDLAYSDESPGMWARAKRIAMDTWSALKRFPLFVKLARIDIRLHPGSYVLSFFAVLLVVMISVVMLTVLAVAPVVFQILAESSVGQLDVSLTTGGLSAASTTLNYTLVKQIHPLVDSPTGYHAPRVVLEAAVSEGSACNDTAAGLWENCRECDEHVTDLGCTAGRVYTTTIFYVPELENRMGYNAENDYAALSYGEALVSTSLAEILGLQQGGRIIWNVLLDTQLRCLFDNNTAALGDALAPLTVAGFLSDNDPKFLGASFPVVLNYDTLPALVRNGLPPSTPPEKLDVVLSHFSDECVTNVSFNIPPSERDEYYCTSDFQSVVTRVSEWASKVTGPLGRNQLDVYTPMVGELQGYEMFNVFVGLVVSLVIFALVVFSIILIYSLMNVNLETRMYELGIQRMIGFTRADLVVMVLVNTYLFTIPGVAGGLGVGQLLFMLVRFVFQKLVAVELGMTVSGSAVGWSVLIGILVPLVASIFPILALVTLSLPMALDATRRPGASGVIYSRTRGSRTVHPAIIFLLGLIFAAFGIVVYYVFPLSALRYDLLVMFYIFFAVLVCLLVGLVLLALNVQSLLELTLLYAVFYWWESPAVFRTIRKSLVAHRLRNRKTTVMYSLSVAFIIFVTVAFDIQFASFRYDTYQAWGTNVRALSPFLSLGKMATVECGLRSALEAQNMAMVPLTYETGTEFFCTSNGDSYFQSPGRYQSVSARLQALPPNFFEVTDKQFLRVNRQRKELTERYSLGGALYNTATGNNLLMSTSLANQLSVGDLDGIGLMKTALSDRMYNATMNFSTTVFKAIATLDASGTMEASPFPSTTGQAVASIPLALRAHAEAHTSVQCARIEKISVAAGNDHVAVVAALKAALAEASAVRINVGYVEEETAIFDLASTVLNLFLILALIMVFVVCFFSLMSTMTTNVLNAAKEVAIFLCMGMSHWQLYRVYLWEAFILVFSSGLLGLLVGLIVAYTLQMQNVLLTQLPVPFSFPYLQLVVIVVVGLLSALIASYSPVKHLLSMPSIVSILRRNLSS